jgi:TRAP-type transport system periplasmic protein
MKKTLAILLSFLVVMSFGIPASAVTRLKLGLPAPPSTPHAKSDVWLSEYVKKHTNGQIIIDVFPLSQLGGERSMAEQVQSGTLEMADLTTAVLSNFVKPTALFDLPFLWPSRGVAYTVLFDSELNEIYRDALKKKGFVMFGWGENEFRDLTNSKRVVTKPEHVKGLKIRVMESPVFLDTWRELGANPVGLPFPEVYTALQQGVIDAQENPLFLAGIMKFIEVNKYATITNYSLTSSIKIMGIDAWEKLTEKQQEILVTGARMATQRGREGNMNVIHKIVGKMEASGKVKITRLTEAQREAFKKAVQPVYAKHGKKAGKIPNNKKYGRFAGMTYLEMIQEKIKQYK